MRQTKRSTAYHEAGHAVAYHVFGFTAARATIVKEADRLGSMMPLDDWESPANTGRQNEKEARRWIVALLAGHAAEVEFCGKDDSQRGAAWRDFDEAEATLRFVRGPSLDVFKVRARNFVRRHRAKIARVADELLRCGTLDDAELDLLITERGRGLDAYRALRAGRTGKVAEKA